MLFIIIIIAVIILKNNVFLFFIHPNIEPAFDTLRTKEQLGYIVFSSVHSAHCVQGIRLIVQSIVADPVYLEQVFLFCFFVLGGEGCFVLLLCFVFVDPISFTCLLSFSPSLTHSFSEGRSFFEFVQKNFGRDVRRDTCYKYQISHCS